MRRIPAAVAVFEHGSKSSRESRQNFSDEAEVSVEEARAWADARGLAFFETSALPPGTKAEAPFRWCAEFRWCESRLQKSQGEFIPRSIAGDNLVIDVFSCWGKASLMGNKNTALSNASIARRSDGGDERCV